MNWFTWLGKTGQSGFARLTDRSLGAWDRGALIRTHYGSVEPPSPAEFLLNTLLCGLIIVPTYFGFSGRNDALLAEGRRLWLPLTSWDAEVPLVPAFVFAYCLFYPAFFVIAVATTADRRVMYEGVIGLAVTAAIGAFFFFALPSQMSQPSLIGCTSTSCALLNFFYEADRGHHIFPSLHVAYPVCIWLLLRRTMPGWISHPFLIVAAAIALSTVLLKRHALVDVPAGVLTGFLGHRVGMLGGRRAATWVRRRTGRETPQPPSS